MSLLYSTENGYFVSQEHRRVAEILRDFDSNLELRFIPPHLRESQEEKQWPFVLVDNPPGKEPYLVMLLEENEINASLIGKVFQTRIDPNRPMERLKALADAQRVYDLKKNQDEYDALDDFHAAMLRSPLHTYKHGGKVYT